MPYPYYQNPYYQPYTPQYHPPMQTQQSTNVIWVNGEAAETLMKAAPMPEAAEAVAAEVPMPEVVAVEVAEATAGTTVRKR